jgi:diguanylate cyclase (GGDEF)-like protein
MNVTEVALWSACMGVFVVCLVASLLNAVFTKTLTGLQSALFVMIGGLFVALGCGMFTALGPTLHIKSFQFLMLASGPMAACVGIYGLMRFLRAHQHDHFVQRGLIAIIVVSALCSVSAGWHDYRQALGWVAVTITGCSFVAFWLVLRSALLGDRFAWPMVVACFFMVLGVMGVYACALGAIDNNLTLQALAAISVATYVATCLLAVWRRNAEYLRMRQALLMHREKDLLTQLWTGAALIKRVDQTIARARRNRQETAIFCVEVFNIAQLRQELGANATEQVIYSLAARVRQSVGSSTEVGRYDDNSFVVIVESVKRPSVLRTIGLRLASSVRKPYMLNPQSTSPRQFMADIGVGIARLPASRDPQGSRFTLSSRSTRAKSMDTSYNIDSMGIAQEAMHDAAALAKQARTFKSHAVIVDAYSRKTVAVEEADLG